MKKNKKVLIIKFGALGDIIMFSGVISALNKIFNNRVDIDWAIGNNLSSIPMYFEGLNKIFTVNEENIYKKNIFYQLIEIIKFNYFLIFKKYDYIYVGHPDSRYKLLLITSFFSKKILLNISNIRYPRLNKNYYTEYIEILEKYFKLNDLDFKFPKLKYELLKERFIKEKYILILPGGGNNARSQVFLKSWPIENYLKLINNFKNTNYKIAIIGDKNDSWISKYIQKLDCIDLINKTNLSDLISIIYYCEVLISNDSGVIHIASLLNKKRITLFGPTNPKSFNYYDKNLITLHNNNKITCSPCYDGKNFPNCKIDKQCMRNISINQVSDKLRNILNAS